MKIKIRIIFLPYQSGDWGHKNSMCGFDRKLVRFCEVGAILCGSNMALITIDALQ
jgi:hypothetical protein